MLNIYSVANFAVSLGFVGVAIFFYIGNSKSSSRIYSFGLFLLALWASEIGFTYFVEDHGLRLFLARFGYLIGIAMSFSFFYFMLGFLEERKPDKRWPIIFFAIESILAILFLGTNLAVRETFFSSADVLNQTWEFGPLIYVFYAMFIIPVIAAFVVLYKKIRKQTDETIISKIKQLFWSSLLGFFVGLSASVILPAFDIFTYAWLGPFFTLGWIILNSRDFIRQKFIPIRIILAEILIFILTIVLFLNIFISNPQDSATPLIQNQVLGGLTRTNIYSNIIWISAILILSYGVISFARLKTNLGRIFGLYAILVAIFSASQGASLFFQDPNIVILWLRLNYAIGIIVAILIFFFFNWLFEKKMPPRWISTAIITIGAFFAYVSTTELVVSKVIVTGKEVIDKFYEYGPLGSLYQIFFVVYFIYIFWRVTKGRRTIQEPRLHLAITYIWWSCILASAIVVGGAFLQPYLGAANLSWLGPIGAFVWMSLSFIAVIYLHNNDIRRPVIETIVLAISILLLVNVFLPLEISFQIPGKILVFGAFTIIGVFFIRNIMQAEKQKEELARLTAELKSTNENLQVAVRDRTKELENSKVHTETVIENLTSGLLEYDNSFVLLRMNKAAENMLGIERNETLGKKVTPQDFTRPGWMSLVEVTYPIISNNTKKEMMDSSVASTVVHDISIRYPEEREIQVITAPLLSGSGETIGFIKTLRDITRERLIARSKSEFISIAAHQLRTPLSVMKWVLGLFLTNEMGNLNPGQREMLSRSNAANEKMINLVNDLLNVSRIEEGKFGYEFGDHDLMETVYGITGDYKDLAKEKSIAFTVEEPTPALPKMYYDEAKITLAIHNVLDNAFHYTKTGGSIHLKVSKRDDWAEICIQDTGIGIPHSNLNRLFSKFFRAENAVKTFTEGSGLGLFIVNNVITRHHGKIEVDSEEGKGSNFRILLPLNKVAIPEKEEAV
jgi:PAS domain S-box-containing protein